MKVTIEVPERLINKAMKMTAKKKSDVVAEALKQYVNTLEVTELMKKSKSSVRVKMERENG